MKKNLTQKEIARYLYLDWIKSYTNNNSLTEDTSGVYLALDILCEVDPFKVANNITSESIGELSQTFATNEEGIPIAALKLLEPYHMVGTI